MGQTAVVKEQIVSVDAKSLLANNTAVAAACQAVSWATASTGDVLTVQSNGTVAFAAVSAGIGGSTGATDNLVLRADGTGGATLQNSGWLIPDIYTSSPNATVNHLSLQATGSSTNVSVSIVPKGTGAFTLAVPDGATTGGNARGPRSIDLQLSRSVSADVADGTDAALIGTFACRNSGNQSVVSGSNISYILGGAYNAISASSNCSINFGNNLNTILSSQYAVARRSCQIIFGSGFWASSGDQQSFMVTGAAKTTTNAAVEVNFGLGNGNVPVYINVHSGYVVSGTLLIHGVKSDGSATARFCRNFTIRRVVNTTTLDNLEVVGVDYPNGTSISITADDTNDRLSVKPTGVLNEIWRWQIHGLCIEQAYGT
jgi:hypothetical protein